MSIFVVDHVALQTNDFEKAFDFYHRVLGFRVLKEPCQFKTRTLCYLSAGSIQLELYSVKAEAGRATEYNGLRAGLDHLALAVGDLETEISRLRGEGVRIVKEPFYPKTDDPNQPKIAFIEGPDKQEIEIREIRRA